MKKTFLAAAALLFTAIGAQAQSTTYAIDPTHTFVTFEVSHFGTSTNRGRFDKKEGTVVLDRAAKTGKVELTLETDSINTGVAPFNKHLQSKDFFNSSEFPTAKFVGDKFSFDGDKVTEVAGTLTLLGKTHPVTLKANRFNCYQNPMLKREVCGGDFETTLQRSQWGMTWGLNMGQPDAVRLIVQVEAVKQ
ncbi:YceI family protein [Aquabacterium sp. A7-Y]|nr:YceI family protein [Aquabacterium sp. A7-Y]MCW7539526.1 YceI family protein [Aquabacterium sp. A7-Y]